MIQFTWEGHLCSAGADHGYDAGSALPHVRQEGSSDIHCVIEYNLGYSGEDVSAHAAQRRSSGTVSVFPRGLNPLSLKWYTSMYFWSNSPSLLKCALLHIPGIITHNINMSINRDSFLGESLNFVRWRRDVERDRICTFRDEIGETLLRIPATSRYDLIASGEGACEYWLNEDYGPVRNKSTHRCRFPFRSQN